MSIPGRQAPPTHENRSTGRFEDRGTGGRPRAATRPVDVSGLVVGNWKLGIVAGALAMTIAPAIFAQTIGAPRPSQHGIVTQRIADTTITVDYNRPVARGRELFGKLVPYGRVWCPCADDATTVETTTKIQIEGQDLPAGRYSLWSEPDPERWTLMFNRNANAWHTRYPEGQDALRIHVAPRSGSHMETLTFYFPVVDGRKAELALHWGTVVVAMKIEVP